MSLDAVLGEGQKVFTQGFKRMFDVFASIIGVGLAYGYTVDYRGWEPGLAEGAFSLLLFASGIAAGVPRLLLIASSTPASLASLVPVEAFKTAWPLALIGLRVARAGYEVRMLSVGLGRLGRLIDAIILQVGILALTTVVGGSLILYIVESGEPATGIHTLGDALWLTLVTIATVGYGDIVPVTGAGRAVASGVMLVGIGIYTFLLSSLAAGLVKVVVSEERLSPIEEEKRLLIDKVKRIEELSDQDYAALKKQLDILYIVATADKRSSVEIDLSPESLGVPRDLLEPGEEAPM